MAAPSAGGLIVPDRFQSSEESSPPGQGKKSDKSGTKKKTKKSKTSSKKEKGKKSKKSKSKRDEDDEDDDPDADHQSLGNEDDDDDDDEGSFDDLDGYDELVLGQEGRQKPHASMKRPATASKRAPKKTTSKEMRGRDQGPSQDFLICT